MAALSGHQTGAQVVEDVFLQSTFPAMLHAGPNQRFPCLSGGQNRPTERAMVARSARPSAREEDAASTDEENRLLNREAVEEHLAGQTLV